MTLLILISLFSLPFLAQIRVTEAGCCCCCCPSCCCKPIIIKLPPPPVKLCPCCCGCCCCKPCCCCCCKPCCCCCCPCCCGGGGGRKRRSIVDMMSRKFSDVLLPEVNQDAMMTVGCGGNPQGVSLSPLQHLCSQIPPSQRGPACQQITQQQQFPLSQNIFNHMNSNGAEFDCQNCAGNGAGNCPNGACPNCQNNGGHCSNCAQVGGGQMCNGPMCNPQSNVFRPMAEENTFNLSQNFASPCGLGNPGGRRKKRSLFIREQRKSYGPIVLPKGSLDKEGNARAEKREVKNQLVFRNNLEFVLRQSPLATSVNL